MRLGLRMMVSGMVLVAVTLAGARVASAQAADPAKPVLTLEGDAAVITFLIKPEKTADFEAVIAKLKDALSKSDKAERKSQLASMKVYKSPQQSQGSAVYVMLVEPVMKDQEYDITRLIAEVFPVEVQEIFKLYKDSFNGRGITILSKLP